jgi:hypothetical protein
MADDADTWWNYQGALVPDPSLLATLPKRGVLGGLCSNRRCKNEGADWYNRTSGLYYCDDCARHLNEQCLAEGTRKVCELRL